MSTKDKTYQFSIPVWLELNVEAGSLPKAVAKLIEGEYEINEEASIGVFGGDTYNNIKMVLNAIDEAKLSKPKTIEECATYGVKVTMDVGAYEDGEEIDPIFLQRVVKKVW